MGYDYMDCAAKRVTEEGVPTCGAGVSPKHPLVTTLEQLDALDESEMIEGYLAAERGDPEPGTNHSLAYCHGWRSRMYDLLEMTPPPEHTALVHEWLARERNRRASDNGNSGRRGD